VDLLGLLKVLVDRWTVTLPVLLCTAAVAVYMQGNAGSVYEATGSILVSEPASDPTTDPVSLTEPAVIAREMRFSEDATALSESPSVSEVVIEAVDERSVRITVTGVGTAAQQTATALADFTTELVATVQEEAGIPEDERIRALTLRVDATATGAVTEADSPLIAATADVIMEDPMANVTNPFAAVPAMGRLLQVSGQSDAGRQQVAARTAGQIEFELNQDPLDRAPIIEVYVVAPSQAAALDGFDVVVDVVSADLDRRQARAGVRSNERLVIEVLAAPQQVRDVSPPISRAVAATLALGVMLAVAAAVLAENVSRRRAVWLRGSARTHPRWLEQEPAGGPTADPLLEPAEDDADRRRSRLSPPAG
jgi:hypothetical protein